MATLTSDTVCETCEEGTYNEDTSHFDLTCANTSTVCQPGWYVSQQASVTSNRECRRCDPGFYSTTQNAASCINQSRCDSGEYQIGSPSSTSDRVCGSKACHHSCGSMCYAWCDVVLLLL